MTASIYPLEVAWGRTASGACGCGKQMVGHRGTVYCSGTHEQEADPGWENQDFNFWMCVVQDARVIIKKI